MITRLRYPKGYQFFDANGAPLALGNLYYYVAGTTTPQDTYSDSAGTVANTNPIVLDGSGRLDVDIYLGSTSNYKEVLTTPSSMVAPWPDDNIPLATQPDWNASSGPNQILNKPVLAAVATSGSYTDLSNTPPTNAPFTGDSGSGGTTGLVPAPVAGDAVANMFLSAAGGWATPPGATGSSATNLSVTQTASGVGIGSSSGTGVTIPAATSTAAGVLDSARAAKIDGLAAVAASGSYSDLSNKPSIPSAPSAMTGATQSASGAAGLAPAPSPGQQELFLRGDATWAAPSGGSGSSSTNLTASETANSVTIASSSGTGATIPAATSTAAGVLDAARAAKIDGLAAVASSGSYTDLTNQPAIPAAQVNSDWNAVSGAAQILNKPTLGTAAAVNVPSSGNAMATQAVLGADTRLSDSRAPLSHALTHASGGSDPVSISASQVSGIAAALASQNLDNIARLGVGTTDTGNALSVKAPSVLFSNSGDMRATVSKGGTPNTAAIDFQDNFSTRAQFGLLGNDNLTIATSPDGSTFNNAIVTSPGGAVSFPNTGGFAGDSGSGGSSGLVPAPSAGTAAAGAFLKADGTWSVPAGSSVPAMTGATSGTSGATGMVPAPSAGQQNSFLRGDATWDVITASAVTGLATVATSGSYTDLANKPSIPAAQVNSDWNATSGLAQILNKPTIPAYPVFGGDLGSGGTSGLVPAPSSGSAAAGDFLSASGTWSAPSASQISGLAAVATTGAYSSLTGAPTIPATMTGATSSSAGGGGTVPAPSAGQQAYVLSGAGTWVAQSGGMANPMTAAGDLMIGGTGGTPTRLGVGSNNQVLTVSGGVPVWAAASSGGVTNYGMNYGVGSGVLNSSMTGTYNLAGGYQSGAALTSGSNNVLLGSQAGGVLKSGGNNVAIGSNALSSLTDVTSGYSNFGVAIGYNAMAAQQQFCTSNGGLDDGTHGYSNIAIGFKALAATTYSWGNVAIGRNALTALTSNGSTPGSQNFLTANFNVAIGDSAGAAVTTGSENQFIGNNTGMSCTTGWQNTGVGTEALKYLTTGQYNNAFGGSAFKSLTTGNNNSGFGNNAGGTNGDPSAITTGSNNTYLGANATNYNVGIATSAPTTSGSILTFASVPVTILAGMQVADFSNSPAIPAGTTVTATTGTTVTLSQNVASTVASGDTIYFYGLAVQLVTTAAAASGNTLTFGNGVPLSIGIGSAVNDLTTSGAIPSGTTVTAVNPTSVVLSASVTGGGVLNGDTILFQNPQYNNMTVIGYGAQGNRSHGIFLGTAQENVIIGGAGVSTLAGLSIGSGGVSRAAINIAQNAPIAATNGDIWRDYSDNLWFRANGVSLQLNSVWSNTNSDVFMGPSTGNASVSGADNTFVGSAIGPAIAGGAGNTLIGSHAGHPIAAQNYTTIIGAQAGNNLGTGASQNTIVGAYSATGGLTGTANVLMGYNVGTAMTSGASNVVIGVGSGNAIASGYGDTIVGENSGTGVTGSTNTIIGYSTGGGLTSGAGNTIIGANLGSLSNPSNTLILGAGGNQLLVADSTTVRPQKPVRMPSYTFSGLPSASTVGAGSRAWITDSTLAYNGTNIGSTAAGGGSYGAPVISNGTNWIIS